MNTHITTEALREEISILQNALSNLLSKVTARPAEDFATMSSFGLVEEAHQAAGPDYIFDYAGYWRAAEAAEIVEQQAEEQLQLQHATADAEALS